MLEVKIQNKKRELEAVLLYAMRQAPVYLPVVKSIKLELQFCDFVLKQLNSKRTRVRSG